ncbi:MAG: SelT/SelW/SelH family protein [Planctomycetes bacterium]|nr:SelT/SelW/SelH family protein [Planctomycetota bacterium]
MGLAKALMEKYASDMKKLILVPSDGGKFEVTVNGKPVFSKLDEGRFPKEEEVIRGIDKVMRNGK